MAKRSQAKGKNRGDRGEARSDAMKALNTTLTSPDEDARRSPDQDRPRGRGRQTVRASSGAATTTAPDVQPRPDAPPKLPDLRGQTRRPEKRATIASRQGMRQGRRGQR